MLRFINSFCKFTVELHLVETLKQLSNDFKSFVTDSSPPSNQSNLNYQLTISSNVNKSIIEFSRVQIDLWVGFNWINESMNQWTSESFAPNRAAVSQTDLRAGARPAENARRVLLRFTTAPSSNAAVPDPVHSQVNSIYISL